ncbi:pre-mRNA-splicing factor rse1, partial [Spiromyces aspiralis]
FQDLGDDTETPEYSSTDYDPESEDMVFTYFQPHELSSLAMVDEVEATSPLIEAKVLNLAEEETPQIYALCGRGAGSALKILRHGLEMSELAVSELPGNPRAVWTVKKGSEEQFDTYIVVSFLDATLVLSVGEEVEEATNTEFQIDVPTLCVHELGKDSMLQVTAGALRHIRHDGRVSEWKTPRNREIVAAAANESQVLIALNRGELVYFELDLASNTLREWGERVRMGAEVTALAVMQRPEGRVRAPFAAVASQDQTVRVLSLNPESCMQQQSMQAVVDMPESLALVELGGGATSQDQSD